MLSMLATSVPIIVATILNMFFLKTSLFQTLNKPIDNQITLKDGNRLFGANKTWRGFWGMVFFSSICCIAWGGLSSQIPALEKYVLLYSHYENSVLYNFLVGVLLGLAYGIFELPNSFLKRRINIQPGKSKKSLGGIGFIVLDQVDSLFGCVLVVSLVHPMTLFYYISFVIFGGFIHIVLSSLLYLMKLRSNF
ncbi:CDP-archaeol synthase [Paenibacillus sp. AN1007]|uniref:CDP-archaeol synthase n=1 Tax=Paenibacillus sp. AN1007 TaxID=3151385 RepID=A0AAU8NIK0_9BACL